MGCYLKDEPGRCSEGCIGWLYMNDGEIQCCDDCRLFASDVDAEEHVMGCADCALAFVHFHVAFNRALREG